MINIDGFSGGNAAGWMELLLNLSLKSLGLMVIGTMVVLLLRRASAAARHWVWALTLISMLLLPVMACLLPSWPVAWLPQMQSRVGEQNRAVLPALAGTPPAALAVTPSPQPATENTAENTASQTPNPSGLFGGVSGWRFAGVLLWAVGTLVIGFSLLTGILTARRLVRWAKPAEADLWAEELVEACDTLGVRPNLSILQSREIKVPMVWGWRKPVLLVPAEADHWTEARRRLVLLHEVAHIKRRDCLTQLLARAACAVYWLNPLVWVAAWRMRVERERACDDMVLQAGSKASEYADELLQITTGLSVATPRTCAAIAMARRSTLEGRLLAILDASRNRSVLASWAMGLSIILIACFVAPVAMLRGGEPTAPSRSRVRHFVRLVIGETNLTFQGQPTTWEALPKLLAEVPDREHTVLELATTTDTWTLAQFNPVQSQAERLRQQFGFEYLSLIGVQPLGSKSEPSMNPEPAANGQGAGNSEEWKQKLNEEQRAVLDWTDRQFRSYFDSRSFAGLTDQERTDLERRLIDALKGPINKDYYQAINTLAALRSGKAIGPLLVIATDRQEKNCRDRWMAIRALGIIGDRTVVPELIHLVYYPNLNTRWWAQITLVRLTGMNFGKDWEAWGRWWNEQNGTPAFKPEKIQWSSTPEYMDPKNMEEGDRKFLKEIQPAAK